MLHPRALRDSIGSRALGVASADALLQEAQRRAFLLKTPDLILPGFDGPRTFTLVDIKVIDPAAASYVNMTSRSPLHRHRALEVAGPRDYFGPSRRPPLVLA